MAALSMNNSLRPEKFGLEPGTAPSINGYRLLLCAYLFGFAAEVGLDAPPLAVRPPRTPFSISIRTHGDVVYVCVLSLWLAGQVLEVFNDGRTGRLVSRIFGS